MCMRISSWPRRPGVRYLMLAALCVLAVAACGSVSSTGTAKPSHHAPAAKVSLNVVVTPSPGAKPKDWTLRCDPTGGTHPDAKAACRQLLAAKNPFAPLPRGIMCPMIVSGPQKATVTGTFFGRHVDGRFSRLNGCASIRWSQLGHVFGPVHGSQMNGSPVH
jgi:Subtilisin inhibitor-like